MLYRPTVFITFKHLASNYDAVWRVNPKGKLEQRYKNLDGVFNDLKALNHMLSAYGFRPGDNRDKHKEF